jgi:predicted ribosome quality control (RQC) complex YloA/Tae2 family protein
VFRFKSASLGKQDLLVEAPGVFHITSKSLVFPDTPPAYCMFLRKYIQGCSLNSIEQPGFERVVLLKFRTSEGFRVLLIELFSKGNVVLCKEDMTIISALENQNWAARTVRGGVKYEVPPSRNPFEMESEDFSKIVEKSDNLNKSLAVECALGGAYAEEVVFRSNVPRDGKLSSRQVSDIFNSMRSFDLIPINPGVQCGRAVPFKFLSVDDDFVSKASFSEALDSLFELKVSAPKESPGEKKAKAIISDQESRKASLLRESQERAKAGELIYARYSELDSWWKEVQVAAVEKNWERVKRLVGKAPVPAELDLKSKRIVVEL